MHTVERLRIRNCDTPETGLYELTPEIIVFPSQRHLLVTTDAAPSTFTNERHGVDVVASFKSVRIPREGPILARVGSESHNRGVRSGRRRADQPLVKQADAVRREFIVGIERQDERRFGGGKADVASQAEARVRKRPKVTAT